jgi:hypothetical protein
MSLLLYGRRATPNGDFASNRPGGVQRIRKRAISKTGETTDIR